MLIPTGYDGDAIMWHFLHSEDIEYQKLSNDGQGRGLRITSRKSLQGWDFKDIAARVVRTILSWHRFFYRCICMGWLTETPFLQL